jgi:hypothetical protein
MVEVGFLNPWLTQYAATQKNGFLYLSGIAPKGSTALKIWAAVFSGVGFRQRMAVIGWDLGKGGARQASTFKQFKRVLLSCLFALTL